MKFIECRSIITNQFQKKKRFFFLGLKHISSYIIHPFRGAHILVFHMCAIVSAGRNPMSIAVGCIITLGNYTGKK